MYHEDSVLNRADYQRNLANVYARKEPYRKPEEIHLPDPLPALGMIHTFAMMALAPFAVIAAIFGFSFFFVNRD